MSASILASIPCRPQARRVAAREIAAAPWEPSMPTFGTARYPPPKVMTSCAAVSSANRTSADSFGWYSHLCAETATESACSTPSSTCRWCRLRRSGPAHAASMCRHAASPPASSGSIAPVAVVPAVSTIAASVRSGSAWGSRRWSAPDGAAS